MGKKRGGRGVRRRVQGKPFGSGAHHPPVQLNRSVPAQDACVDEAAKQVGPPMGKPRSLPNAAALLALGRVQGPESPAVVAGKAHCCAAGDQTSTLRELQQRTSCPTDQEFVGGPTVGNGYEFGALSLFEWAPFE